MNKFLVYLGGWYPLYLQFNVEQRSGDLKLSMILVEYSNLVSI